MDERRKAAYRYLLYNATQDIRGLVGWAMKTVSHPESKNVNVSLEQAEDTANECFWIAYALHNLALDSAKDFVDFNETTFWQGIDAKSTATGLDFSRYRETFDRVMSGKLPIL